MLQEILGHAPDMLLRLLVRVFSISFLTVLIAFTSERVTPQCLVQAWSCSFKRVQVEAKSKRWGFECLHMYSEYMEDRIGCMNGVIINFAR
jgi:hypothetical protein